MNGRADLLNELEKLEIRDEQDLLRFLPRAARLAALGDKAPLRTWPEKADSYKEQLEGLLVARAQEGCWDLRNAIGEDLGLAIIDAQDFSCLVDMEEDLLPSGGVMSLRAWIDEAEETPLDEDAVATLERFLEVYDLPESFQLGTVHSPVSQAESALLVATSPPASVVELEGVEAMEPVEAFQLLDGTSPPDALRKAYERLDVEFAISGRGTLVVSRRLLEDWRLVVDSVCPEELAPIDRVQVGALPARESESKKSSRWIVELGRFRREQRIRALEAAIIATFRDGMVVRLRWPKRGA